MRVTKLKRRIYWDILRPLVIVFLYFKFGYRFKTARDLPDNYIILSNHNTDFDPLFVGVSFKDNIRFVASEHISRWDHWFNFVNHIFNPIMRAKGTNAASTVKGIIRTLRNGENVGLFAEGARSWNGVTAPILSSTGKMIKSAKCGLVTYKIKGGYFTSPLWSKGGTRKGKISGGVVRVFTKEQLADMSVDEINAIIKEDLHEDAYETQSHLNSKYKGKKLAEKIESMVFACPECESIDALTSSKNIVKCQKCCHTFTYDEFGNINNSKFKTTKEMFSWLKDKVLNDADSNEQYSSNDCSMVIVDNHTENLIAQGTLTINPKVIKCDDVEVFIEDINNFSMHGRNALVFSTKDTYYEILVSETTSALKFYMMYQAYKYQRIDSFNF